MMLFMLYFHYMGIKDPIEVEAKLVLDIYDYALSHNLDITKKSDVVIILTSLGHENLGDEHVERLMTALLVTDHRVKNDVAKRKKEIN